MDLLETIRVRRSIKGFAATPVPRKALLELVDAARYAPSGNNKNPWRFVVVTQREKLDRLSQTHPYCHWLSSAQAGIAIAVDPAATRYWLEDCCLAAYNIWLVAAGQGLGVAWAAMHQSDNPVESERRQRLVRQILSLPEGLYVPMVLGIGYPQAPPPEKKRPDLAEILFWDSYAQKNQSQIA